jgi:hypothetical protein
MHPHTVVIRLSSRKVNGRAYLLLLQQQNSTNGLPALLLETLM